MERILVRLAGRDEIKEVYGYRSHNPLFAVTPNWSTSGEKEVSWKPWCHVTHIGTGIKVASFCTSRKQARMIMGAVAGVPLGWTTISLKNAEKRAAKLPKEIRAWLRSLNWVDERLDIEREKVEVSR